MEDYLCHGPGIPGQVLGIAFMSLESLVLQSGSCNKLALVREQHCQAFELWGGEVVGGRWWGKAGDPKMERLFQ